MLSLAIGIYFTRRASTSMSSYFVSGRNLPWWILGTSMVATNVCRGHPSCGHGLGKDRRYMEKLVLVELSV